MKRALLSTIAMALAALLFQAGASRAEDRPPRLYDEDIPVRRDGIAYVVEVSRCTQEEPISFPDLEGKTVRGSRREQAMAEVVRSIRALGSDWVLNVHVFDASVRSWRPRAAPADGGAKAAAERFLREARPGHGSATGPAIARALEDPAVGTVVVLAERIPDEGDGGRGPGAHVEIVRRANARGASILCFGYGASETQRRFFRLFDALVGDAVDLDDPGPVLDAAARGPADARDVLGERIEAALARARGLHPALRAFEVAVGGRFDGEPRAAAGAALRFWRERLAAEDAAGGRPR